MKYEHKSAQKENPEHMTLTKPLRHQTDWILSLKVGQKDTTTYLKQDNTDDKKKNILYNVRGAKINSEFMKRGTINIYGFMVGLCILYLTVKWAQRLTL